MVEWQFSLFILWKEYNLSRLTIGFFLKKLKWKINNFLSAFKDVFFISKQMFTTCFITIPKWMVRAYFVQCFKSMSTELYGKLKSRSFVFWRKERNIWLKHRKRAEKLIIPQSILFNSEVNSQRKMTIQSLFCQEGNLETTALPRNHSSLC